MQNLCDIPVRYIKGIGAQRAKTLAGLGINSVEDLLYYFPRRYEDRTAFSLISDLQEGACQTIKAQVVSKRARRSFNRRALSIIEVAAEDNSGKIYCVWFNQPYLNDYFRPGMNLILYGKAERYAGRLQMNSPEFEIITGEEDDSLNIGRIVPVYPLSKGINQRRLRKIIKYTLDKYLPGLNDFLSFDIRQRNSLINLNKSLLNIHFPENPDLQKQAYLRLAFEEFFIFQLPLALRKLKRKEKPGIAHKTEGGLVKNFIAALPFKLTRAQEAVIDEIRADMASPRPMQRLLQGDVGSGKTVVATLAGLTALQGGYQVAFMAPTEILARQHYESIGLQVKDIGVRVALLTSSLDKKGKAEIYRQISEGKIDFIIGTHALLEEAVQFKKLGLAVIDEQHKFGVAQRALLPKKGLNPDVLIMTATPIPRTLAITLYGDLDISVINELPAGRITVKTMHFKAKDRQKAYDLVVREVEQGNQVYIIYPVIEDSYALDIAGAKKMYGELKEGVFKEFKVGLVHGKLAQKEQEKVMRGFKSKELDILVATTVLEVGIDVPLATCMVIEQAERFGLSQLHQLRGRVGRGDKQSFCALVSDLGTSEAKSRIEAMLKYSDGFHIAEQDLRIRGPGEFFGSRQSGLSELRVADPLAQMHLLKSSREEVVKLLNSDPRLETRQNVLLKDKLLERFPEYEKLMVTG